MPRQRIVWGPTRESLNRIIRDAVAKELKPLIDELHEVSKELKGVKEQLEDIKPILEKRVK